MITALSPNIYLYRKLAEFSVVLPPLLKGNCSVSPVATAFSSTDDTCWAPPVGIVIANRQAVFQYLSRYFSFLLLPLLTSKEIIAPNLRRFFLFV